MAQTVLPLETSLDEPCKTSGSMESLDSVFTYYVPSETDSKGSCSGCLTRVPYATLIATIMCALGVVVFCGTMYRGATLTFLMFHDVFKLQLRWVDGVKLSFVVVGACMGAVGLMILTVGCLTTGATRHRVYRRWRSRVGGRVSCAVFMTLSYLLLLVWIAMFISLVIITFISVIWWKMCDNPKVSSEEAVFDFTQFSFLFPAGTRQEHMKVEGNQQLKLFCHDYVENVEMMFILATASALLVVLSLVHYLMCLSANYAHIRDQEKFQELQEMQILGDQEILSGKDHRF